MATEERSRQRFENYTRALDRLREALAIPEDEISDMERESLVQRFHYTFELAWQVPGHGRFPTFRIMYHVRASPRWAGAGGCHVRWAGSPEIAIIAGVLVLLFGVGKISGLGRERTGRSQQGAARLLA